MSEVMFTLSGRPVFGWGFFMPVKQEVLSSDNDSPATFDIDYLL